MALELIKINEFPQVAEPGDWIVVSDAAGTGYKISKEDFKAWLGTVTVIADKPIALADPAPTLDGVYLPTEPGTYTNAGGLVYDPQGVDAGKYVQFIKNDTVWTKLAVDLPQAENKIEEWSAGTYAQGDQRIHNGQIWSVAVASTTEEPNGANADWRGTLNIPASEDIEIYDSSTDVIEGSFYNDSGVLVSDSTSSRTDFLDINLASKLSVKGRDGYISSLFFFDENFQFIENRPYPTDITLMQSDLPVGARYVVSNLTVLGSEDISDTLIVTKSVFKDSGELNNRIDNIQEISVRKPHTADIYTSFDEVRGVRLNATTGMTESVSINYGYSGYIDIESASEIVFSGFPSGLNLKWFYDGNKNAIGSTSINNGVLLSSAFPEGVKYLSFNVRTTAVTPTGSELVQADINDVENILSAEGYAKKSQVYRKEYTDIYNGNFVDSQSLSSFGVPLNGPDRSWTGYMRFIQGLNISISGIPFGLNSKFFYDSEFNMVGSVTINNGSIKAEDIPPTAIYLGLNLSNASLGDGRYTAEIYSYIDDLEQLNPDNATINTVFGIPSIIPVVQGIQANIYLDNIRSNPVNNTQEVFVQEGAPITSTRSNPYIYKVKRAERSLQYTPSIAGETVQMYARLRDINYNILKERPFQFRSVDPNSGSGLSKICLLCGDSQIDTTYDGAETSFAPFLKDAFDQSGSVNMQFVGSQVLSETVHYGETEIENRLVSCPTEGYGGRQINWFYENTSPFWNPNKVGGAGVDFANWMIEQGREGEVIDFFVFPMGVNDFNAGVSTPDIIERYHTMQSLLWESFPDCKFIVGMVTQGSEYWSMDVRRKWNIEFYDALVEEFEKPEYNGKVFLSAAGLWTDNIFGSRQIRPFVEPYKRIVDTKMLLVNKLRQGGLSEAEALEKVNVEYGLEVKERTLVKWEDEHPNTNDIVHSSWVSAMQQADCYYSSIKYLLSI